MAGNWFLSSKLFSRMRAQLAVLLVLLFSGTADATVLRLQGSLSEYDGRVEVLYEKEWGSICDVGWDLTDANVRIAHLLYINLSRQRVMQCITGHLQAAWVSIVCWCDCHVFLWWSW